MRSSTKPTLTLVALAFFDLGIALVKVEIGAELAAPFRDQPLLCPCRCPVTTVGCSSTRAPVDGLPRGSFLRHRLLARPGSAPRRPWDRPPWASVTRSVVTTRSGSSVSVGVSFGRSVSLTSAFCSGSAGEATEASVSGPAGRSVSSIGRRRQFDADVALRAQIFVAGVALQMRERQRAAAEMQRERGHRRQNPQPPRGLLFGVEVGHQDVTDSLKVLQLPAPSSRSAFGTPSSATSLILV